MKARLSLVLAATLGLAACQGDETAPSASSAASPVVVQENFLTIANDASLETPQRGRLSAIRQRANNDDTHLARLATGPAALLRRGGALRLAVAPGVQVVAQGERVEQRSANDISWGGRVQGVNNGYVQMVYSPEGVTGTVTLDRVQYRIEPLGNGLHAVSRMDQNGFPSEHPADHPAGALDVPPPTNYLAAKAPEGTVGAAALSTINVLVVYTASAASAAGNIASKIQLAVDETNQSYVNSGININMVRVHTAQVTYNESGRSFSQHVAALRSTTDGVMDNVHTLRNTYAADVVLLVVNDSEACGIASSIGSTATSAFAVAHWDCITGYYSFGHEIGHLQGARHDRFVDGSTTPYAYGHGFIPAAKNWRTVMAYGNNCSNCTRIQYWSNPLKTYSGVAMGTVAYEDNARVLNLTAASVAAYR
ncbi:M12 family metallo-peptidase [Longimicrobium sp.]|uniref:M12 family metallo-peptidase n=1 Tax=Longimicrobium sp. TaxID=2029185 RepID=UPI002E334811|nr:M12 family metallo-peptidase [Longimicrobium sp.]HEX6041463.1 M12 family metallo-peptidase [Longimicrobium sp.]